MGATKIEWAERSWNPITGCDPESEGCLHCYARLMAHRLAGRAGYDRAQPFGVTFHPDRLEDPLSWKGHNLVFVESMGDPFHPLVKCSWLEAVWRVMEAADDQTFIVLTKRERTMYEWIVRWGRALPNVWLGVTAENQVRADQRVPVLLRTPAALRFVSVEPMLSAVTMRQYLHRRAWVRPGEGLTTPGFQPRRQGPRLDWVICGAETGIRRRHMDPNWAISLARECEEAAVPFFFKKDSEGRPFAATESGMVKSRQYPGGVPCGRE